MNKEIIRGTFGRGRREGREREGTGGKIRGKGLERIAVEMSLLNSLLVIITKPSAPMNFV